MERIKLDQNGKPWFGTRRARREDVLPRTDLPEDHPFYGHRVVEAVVSGMGDCEIDDNGELVPIALEDDDEARTATLGDE